MPIVRVFLALLLLTSAAMADTTVRIHYHRPAADYEGWNLWVWPEGGAGREVPFAGLDEFGAFGEVTLEEDAPRVGVIVRRGNWDEKDGEGDRFIDVREGNATAWLKAGDARVYARREDVRYTPQPVRNSDEKPAAPRVEDLRRVAPESAKSVGAEAVAVVHYRRADGRYAGWDVWAWSGSGGGKAYAFDGEAAFGKHATIKLDSPTDRVHFIVRKSDWSAREPGGDRSVAINDAGVGEAWLLAGDRTLYDDPAAIDFRPKAVAAFLDEPNRIRVQLSEAAKVDDLPAEGAEVRVGESVVKVREVRPVGMTLFGAERWDVLLASPVKDLSAEKTLTLPGYGPAKVEARDVLRGEAFVAPEAKLGYEYAKEATTFRTWAPTARRVELVVGDEERVVEMTRGERGLWEAQVEGDLHGTAYAYRFHTGVHEPRLVPDVHGFAATADSSRSVVIDLRRTDPKGFRSHNPPTVASPVDEIIYEVHVRDFSVFDDSIPAELRGKYLGMTHPRGRAIAHLKDLGVTTVHLLPIQDFGGNLTDYTWGYWTELFNVPEASYATNPHDPEAVIRELKATIQALHEAGIRVVLDVVYNHTASSHAHSPFDQAVPWHYFRSDDNGMLRNESGTGNAFADERPMARKYVVDSLRFWLEEYKVDGFRFDLVGMHHPETVREIERELRAIRPDVLLYGEPWTGGGPTHFGKGAQRGMHFAVFNDHLRGAIRGDLDGTGPGFMFDGRNAGGVMSGVAASLDDFASSPIETINYVSAHDNLTLWDKIEKTAPNASEAQKRAMQKLAHGIVLTSQGVPFIHGGCSFARTKGGNHNSYNASDEVNQFDWVRKERYRDVYEYVRGLVALRKANAALRMSDASSVRQHLAFLAGTPEGVVAYTIDAAAAGEGARDTFVAYNGSSAKREVALPEGKWSVVVDAERAGTEELRTARGKIALPGHSMVVAIRE